MKTILLLAALLLPTLALADHHKEAKAEKAGAYRHVVILKFKEDAKPGQIKKVEKEFAALAKKIDTITDIEWGTNVSPEDHAKGFTHCFIVSFKDKAGLEVYLPHKAHKDFVKVLVPVMKDVFDFVAK